MNKRYHRAMGDACSLLADSLRLRVYKITKKLDSYILVELPKEQDTWDNEHPLHTFSINNKRDDLSFEVRVQMYDDKHIKISLDKLRGGTESIYIDYEGDESDFTITSPDKIEEFAIITSAMSTGGM